MRSTRSRSDTTSLRVFQIVSDIADVSVVAEVSTPCGPRPVDCCFKAVRKCSAASLCKEKILISIENNFY